MFTYHVTRRRFCEFGVVIYKCSFLIIYLLIYWLTDLLNESTALNVVRSRSLNSGDDVKFEEFVQYVLQEALHGHQQMDNNWRPQYEICEPCHVKYDFIGHYETIRRDAEHVLRQIARPGNNTDVQFPATDLDSRNQNSRGFLRKFYASVSPHNIFRLLQLYRRDYETFGYEIPCEIRRKLHIKSKISSTT